MAAFCRANLAVIPIATAVCAAKSNSFWNWTNCQFDLELELILQKRMLYSQIKDKVKTWTQSSYCQVRRQLDYMRSCGYLRPVQIDAIETYLFLKIECDNRPLHEILSSGSLNTLDPDALRVSQPVRDYLSSHPASLALLQFASQGIEGSRNVLAPALRAKLETEPQSIDASAVFRDLFYGVSYTDYLFSLPMGAGKTYLMAAFIYLDLAFALQEPDNSVFAKNFLILAPSGLKSSIIPSLRTIQAFNPAWIVAEPLASHLRRQLRFMVLDADSSASRSNRVHNPNVQKLASLQPFDDLVGLVAVTNAEKVILDRLPDDSSQLELFGHTEDEQAAAANELRATIAKIPALSVFIDEAHHTPARNQNATQSKEASAEVKLRRVVSQWAASHSVRTVLGFSGTPFLSSPERIEVAPGLEIKTSEIANTVHYFPLVNGIGSFLKKPVVQIVRDAPASLDIVERGINEFFTRFRNKRYASGACAKLAIYCGSISRLETQILPLATRLCEENGIDPVTGILRYHRGDRDFPAPEGAELAFATLDTPHSPVRLILLVQIGKEGWDCRSLAGVVLSQEGDCPMNMVLQTSCRCLREVEHGVPEEAIIVLNESNGRQLIEQLKRQQHATLDEFQHGTAAPVNIERFDRTKVLRLPDLPFFQLSIFYGAEIKEDDEPPAKRLKALQRDLSRYRKSAEVTTGSFDDIYAGNLLREKADSRYGLIRGDIPSRPYRGWLDLLRKESFGFWTPPASGSCEDKLLRDIHKEISFSDASGAVFLSPEYDQSAIRACVVTAFWPRRRLSVREETVPETARLLVVEKLYSPVEVPSGEVTAFVPDQNECHRIVEADSADADSSSASSDRIAILERKLAEAEAEHDAELATIFRKRLALAKSGQGAKDRSYHYLPYRTDSAFERRFLEEALHRAELAERNLEVYYNGDSSLTEFRIHCYRRLPASQGGWTSVGLYTPDFLILHRDKKSNAIDACLVIETKGRLYANDPAFQERKTFASGEFLRINDSQPGHPRFQYLCLEEAANWQHQFLDAVKAFFK